jgi:hypothetical protein
VPFATRGVPGGWRDEWDDADDAARRMQIAAEGRSWCMAGDMGDETGPAASVNEPRWRLFQEAGGSPGELIQDCGEAT